MTPTTNPIPSDDPRHLLAQGLTDFINQTQTDNNRNLLTFYLVQAHEHEQLNTQRVDQWFHRAYLAILFSLFIYVLFQSPPHGAALMLLWFLAGTMLNRIIGIFGEVFGKEAIKRLLVAEMQKKHHEQIDQAIALKFDRLQQFSDLLMNFGTLKDLTPILSERELHDLQQRNFTPNQRNFICNKIKTKEFNLLQQAIQISSIEEQRQLLKSASDAVASVDSIGLPPTRKRL